MKKLLLTGAGGHLGRLLRDRLNGWAEHLVLSDITDLGEARPGETLVTCDLADMDSVQSMVADCDAIIHLGGVSTENTFDNILNSNIKGTYNLFEAARKNGSPRILFASSNHVIGFHDRETRLDASSKMRPDSLYGVSKGFGELLAQYYYDKFGLESASVRIGSCFERPKDRRMLATWMSLNDFLAMIDRVFTADRLGCPVIYGASNNRECWWDNHEVRYLGWQPLDTADSFRDDPNLQEQAPDPTDPAVRYQGGKFAAAGHFEDPQ